MNRHLGISAVTCVMLGGCATGCRTETYFKPEIPPSGVDLEVSRSNWGLEFRVHQDVYVDLAECGWGFRSAGGGAVTLCLTVAPEDGVPVQFHGRLVRFGDGRGAQTSSAEIDRLHYSIFCKESGPEPRCSSSLSPSTDSELSRARGNSYGGSYSVGVDIAPESPWRGTLDSQYGYMLIPHRYKLRQYKASVAFPRNDSAVVSTALPPLIVNGRTHVLPSVVFHRVTESVCAYGT